MNHRFLSLNALQGGDFQLHLSRKSKVTDVDSGKVLATNADTFTIQTEAQGLR